MREGPLHHRHFGEVAPSLEPKSFTLRTIRARLDAQGDLFSGVLAGTFQLAPVLARLRTER